jgi:hypothetical protein
MRGVVDNNTFDAITYVLSAGTDCPGNGTPEWNAWPEIIFGSSAVATGNLYFEDNDFINVGTAISNCDEGGRYVFRYNQFDGAGGDHSPWFDAHGGRGLLRGCFVGEIYGNRWVSDSGYIWSHRGGRGVLFYNSSVNSLDYNPYNNDGCPPAVKEQMNNSYIFGNRVGFTGALLDRASPPGPAVCAGDTVENSRFFMDAVPVGGAQTIGISMGTLAARPASCTPGTGYWATNQSTTDLTGMVGMNPTTVIAGTLYQCGNVAYGGTSGTANTWTSIFTPLAYPHSLRGAVDTIPPSAPTGVRVE